MNTQLPNTTKQTKGFTLIELLVVIAIIAVLAIMGFAAFRGFTTRGNDARRQADLKSIGDALEANKISTGYLPLATSQFASGTVPIDPVGGAAGNATHGGYCISASTSGTLGTAPTLAQLFSAGACGAAVVGVGAKGAAWTSVATGVPAATTTVWMVCGATGDPAAAAVCRNSAQ